MTLREAMREGNAAKRNEIEAIEEIAQALPAYDECDLVLASALLHESALTAEAFFATLAILEAKHRGAHAALLHLERIAEEKKTRVLTLVHAAVRLELTHLPAGSESTFLALLRVLLPAPISPLWKAQSTLLLTLSMPSFEEAVCRVKDTLYLAPYGIPEVVLQILTKAHLLVARTLRTPEGNETVYAVRGALAYGVASLLAALHRSVPTFADAIVGPVAPQSVTVGLAGLTFHLPAAFDALTRAKLLELLSRVLEQSRADREARDAFFIEQSRTRTGARELTLLGLFLPSSVLEALGLLRPKYLEALVATRSIYRKGPLVVRYLSPRSRLRMLRILKEEETNEVGVEVSGLIFLNFATGDTYHLERSIGNALALESHTKGESQEEPQTSNIATHASKFVRAQGLLKRTLEGGLC